MPISLNNLKQVLDFNREQTDFNEDEISKGMCPYDDWKLNVNEKGEKACPVCGRIFS